MTRSERDVIIVGSGPIGLACAVEAIRRKRSHLVLEKGCLLQTLVDFPLTMTFFSTSDRLEIGEVPFVSHGPKPTREEALQYYRRVAEHWGVQVRSYEEVTGVEGAAGDFTIVTAKGRHRCASVILALGFYGSPNLMNIPGEGLPKVSHYYREPYPYAGQKVLVVGGGNSAVDAALELFRTGAEVTMATPSEAIDASVKYWVRPDIENRIREGSIRAFFGAKVVSIQGERVHLDGPAGEVVIDNDFVLAMTGYHPDYELLRSFGVECTGDSLREPLTDPETQESTTPGIYCAGVVCNGLQSGRWLIENSRVHGRRIFDHLEGWLPTR